MRQLTVDAIPGVVRRGARALVALALAGGTLLAGMAGEAQAKESWSQWVQGMESYAIRQGISPNTARTALGSARYLPRVVELDRNQPEFKLTFQQYLDRVIPQSRVNKARALYRQNRALLQQIEQRFQVPGHVVVALWGIESDFGNRMGGFPIISALATLTYDGRRRKFFQAELIHALRILDEGHITLSNMKGSWAGAMGQVQFMPSSFVDRAVDFTGDGRKDIWGTRADALASAANYLHGFGWNPAYTWGRQVQVPAHFNHGLAGLKNRLPLTRWRQLGLRRADGGPLPVANITASLIEPDGASGPSYLVYHNFRVIRRWNPSNYFALAVGLLADKIVR